MPTMESGDILGHEFMGEVVEVGAAAAAKHRYMAPLLNRIEKGEIDPSGIITHRAKLADAPALYKKFRDHQDGCIEVVMTP